MTVHVIDEQRAEWQCPRCGSKRSVGYGMWEGSGPVKAQCVPCGHVSDWPNVPEPTQHSTPPAKHDADTSITIRHQDRAVDWESSGTAWRSEGDLRGAWLLAADGLEAEATRIRNWVAAQETKR